MFKFLKDLQNLKKLRVVRRKLKAIEENKLPPKFPCSLFENPCHFIVHKEDYGADATSYMNDVIHGKQSPIRDLDSSEYTYSQKVNISINFWDLMAKWCEKNKEYCHITLINEETKKELDKCENNLLNELGL